MTVTRRHLAGFSLVELLVALALALAISALVARIWTNNRQSFRNQDNNARLQENARFALQILERELRQAGYKGLNQEAMPADRLFGATPPLYPALSGTNDSTVTVNGLTTDALSVAYYGSGTGANGDGTVSNCFGVGVPGGTLVRDTFTVRIDGANGPALVCLSTLAGSPALPTPLVYGIETLQVIYGEETDNLGTRIPNRYVPAVAGVNFDNVSEVRLSLLVRGEDRTTVVTPQAPSALKAASTTGPSYGVRYYHFGTTATSPYTPVDTGDAGAVSDLSAVADGRQRGLYGTTVALRNRNQ